ncbi:MAG TPA: TetR family transcriptional regulator [Solirubrobacteraceae bacterium]|jgi:AcrR family transcriptional regulator|nr:TetR family transcriptional regulator [Solirubrobacteraceae bacterium]
MATATVPTRRRPSTQAERRAVTQAALLDATIECLVAYGHAKTTTGRIAELAGVSRGAQLPYFRSRADIVGAAVAHLADKRISAVAARFEGKQVTLEECLDALWEEHQGPIFAAALELWVASRTDPELRANLLRIERDVAVAVARTAESALGPTARRAGFPEDLIFALATVRGLALLQISNGGSDRALAKDWQQTRERLLRLLS